jgi:beta-galactosidase
MLSRRRFFTTAEDLGRILDEIHRVFPAKPVVISEYGYCACTPDRPEGDGARISVLLGHDSVFRQRNYVAGLIFFCYNDYRTHVGDRGKGALQQRVHGVVDVYGAPKPSYEELRSESSPLERFEVVGRAGELQVQLKARGSVPAYTLRGYRLRTVVYGFGQIPVERLETKLPDLGPGQQKSVTVRFAEGNPVWAKLDATAIALQTSCPARWRAGTMSLDGPKVVVDHAAQTSLPTYAVLPHDMEDQVTGVGDAVSVPENP